MSQYESGQSNPETTYQEYLADGGEPDGMFGQAMDIYHTAASADSD